MDDSNQGCFFPPQSKVLFCRIYLEGSDEGQGPKKHQMLLRIVETLLNQLSPQNNKDKLHCTQVVAHK